MATELLRSENPPTITADGTFIIKVKRKMKHSVKIDFSTGGSAGDITILDAQLNPERNEANTADLVVSGGASPTPLNKFVVTPTGGHIGFLAENFAGDPIAGIHVNEQPGFG